MGEEQGGGGEGGGGGEKGRGGGRRSWGGEVEGGGGGGRGFLGHHQLQMHSTKYVTFSVILFVSFYVAVVIDSALSFKILKYPPPLNTPLPSFINLFIFIYLSS